MKRKETEMKTTVGGILFLIGLGMIVGTAGSVDMELISGAREALQLIIGWLVSLGGFRLIMKGEQNGN